MTPFLFFFFPSFSFCFLGLYLQHMEVPRLGVELDLQLPATTTARATQDPSCVCNLHHSSQQHRIPNTLSGARDRTCHLMVTSQIHFRCDPFSLEGEGCSPTCLCREITQRTLLKRLLGSTSIFLFRISRDDEEDKDPGDNFACS